MIYLDEKFFNYDVISKKDKELYAKAFALKSDKELDKDTTFRFEYGCENSSRGIDRAFCESGFFNSCFHIDKVGLYSNSSFCLPNINEIIDSYIPPIKCSELFLDKAKHSKFTQPTKEVDWFGVVLALQAPNDFSIRHENNKINNSISIYEKFVEDCCRAYGKDLFLKVHPWNSKETIERYRNISTKYGCTIDKVGLQVIRNCKFVIIYNSGFSIDCLLNGVKVVQYAPGYFYKCNAITYTNGTFPKEAKENREAGYRLCDFLLWRYCTSNKHSTDTLIEMFQSYTKSTEQFPLEERFSYGEWLKSNQNN